jgi:hypothetical protein
LRAAFFYKAEMVRNPPPPNTSVVFGVTEMMDSVKNDRLINCNIFFASVSLTFCREYFLSCP